MVARTIAAIGIGLPARGYADDRYPMMSYSRPVDCMRDKAGDVWRIQCDHATGISKQGIYIQLGHLGHFSGQMRDLSVVVAEIEPERPVRRASCTAR